MQRVSDEDIGHLELIRESVRHLMREAASGHPGGPARLLDIAPQEHEGARPFFPAEVVVDSFDIDPSGTLPDGRSFRGPAELKATLKGKKEWFARCLAEKMLTYAMGRGLEYHDRCAVDKILGALAANDYRFGTLLVEVVKSEPFQMRAVKGGKE